MTTTRPTVTVILTVYNGEPHVSKAVESIQRQIFEDWEFVIIDDGSTDSTLSVLQSFEDTRIRIYTQENKGRSQSLTRGLGLARGEYVAIIDDDDLAAPTRLEKSVDFLNEHPGIDLVATGYERSYENEKNTESDIVSPPKSHEELINELPFRNPFGHSLVMYRRSTVEELAGYRDLHSCIDYDLWIRMAISGCQFGVIDESLGTIRKHENRSFNFDWKNHLRYLWTAYTLRAKAARGLDVPLYYRIVPLVMLVWGILPSPIKPVIRKIIHEF